MEKFKCHKIWAIIVIIVALVIAILASFWPQDRLADIIYITRFFDVTLPILAFGALIKYLISCGGYKGGCGCDCSSCNKCSK